MLEGNSRKFWIFSFGTFALPIAEFCQETQAAGCQSDCENDPRGTCVESHVYDNGSAQCFCTYTLS